MAVLNLHHYGAPDSAPTLAFHGVTAHGEGYRRLAQEGFPERRWLAVALRGHGRSTWDGQWKVERHVADLLETLDAEGVDRVEVVGHSYCGMIALHLLAKARDRGASRSPRAFGLSHSLQRRLHRLTACRARARHPAS
jgi:lipase